MPVQFVASTRDGKATGGVGDCRTGRTGAVHSLPSEGISVVRVPVETGKSTDNRPTKRGNRPTRPIASPADGGGNHPTLIEVALPPEAINNHGGRSSLRRLDHAGQGVIAVNIVGLMSGISGLLEQTRRTAACSVNSILTATYCDPGHFRRGTERFDALTVPSNVEGSAEGVETQGVG